MSLRKDPLPERLREKNRISNLTANDRQIETKEEEEKLQWSLVYAFVSSHYNNSTSPWSLYFYIHQPSDGWSAVGHTWRLRDKAALAALWLL